MRKEKPAVAAHQETFLQSELQSIVKPSLWGNAGNPQVMSTTVGLAGAAGGPWRKYRRELVYLGSSDLSDHIKATRPAGLSAGRVGRAGAGKANFATGW